jgi:hypothetical protein
MKHIFKQILTTSILASVLFTACKPEDSVTNISTDTTPVKTYHVKMGTVANTSIPRFVNLSTGNLYNNTTVSGNTDKIDLTTNLWNGVNVQIQSPNNYDEDANLGGWQYRNATYLNATNTLTESEFNNILTNSNIESLHTQFEPSSSRSEVWGDDAKIGAVLTIRTNKGLKAVARVTNSNGNSTDPNGFVEMDIKIKQ